MAEVRLVALCQHRTVTAACWNNAGVLTPILIHPAYDSSNAPIPAGTLGNDGSTDIGTAFTALDGGPLGAVPALTDITLGACPLPVSDLELGCMVDPTDPTADPIPVYVTIDTEPEPDPDVVVYTSLIDGTVQTPSATLAYEPNCDRFQYVQSRMCVYDATGTQLASGIIEVRAYDNSDTSDGAATIEPVAVQLLDAAGAAYTLPENAVLGDCNLARPELVYGCLSDPVTTPATLTDAYQLIPYINGVPSVANATYQSPTDGAVLTPGAGYTFRPGESCGVPCLTC